MGDDHFQVVLTFFGNGMLLKQINNTLLMTLMAKKSNASKVSEYIPIALRNVLYKLIVKVLTNRVQLVLPDVIGMSQSAFIRGWDISNNMMLAHQLIKHYERNTISSRTLIKIDICKAYDTLN